MYNQTTPYSTYNVTSGPYTNRTNFSPLQPALTEAERLRLQANQAGQTAAVTGLNEQYGEVSRGTGAAQQYYDPYIQQGSTALNNAAGVAGSWDPNTYAQVMNSPQLQNTIKQGVRASEQSAAAKGNLFSGAHAAELQQIGQDASAQYLNQLYNQNMGLATLGSENAGRAGTTAYNAGSQLGGIVANRGNVNANAALARGDISAQTALEKAKAQVAQSTVSGLQPGQTTGLVNGTGLAQYNPNTNPDPWGNAAALKAGSAGGTSLSSAGSGLSSGGGYSSGGGASKENLGFDFSQSPFGGSNTSYSGGAAPPGSTSSYTNLAGQSLAPDGTQTSNYNFSDPLNPNSLVAGAGVAQGGLDQTGSFSNVANNLTSGVFGTNTGGGSATGGGAGGLSGNPGGNVPQDTWDNLDPKYQTQVSDAYNRAVNSGSSVWQQYQAMMAEARKLSGPAQNALVEAANAMSSSLRQ